MLVRDVLVGPHRHLLTPRIVGHRLTKETDELSGGHRPGAGVGVAATVDVDDELARTGRERLGGRCLGKGDVDRPIILLELAGDEKENHQQKDDVDHRRQVEPAAESSLVDADTHTFPPPALGSAGRPFPPDRPRPSKDSMAGRSPAMTSSTLRKPARIRPSR